MKSIKRYLNRMLSLGLAVVVALSLSIGVFAAEPAGISVQLNGEKLTLTDVAPFARNGRTYVPFRVLFEELGATVDYDAATQTVTAVRSDTTVQFVLGQSEVMVTTNGEAKTITIDAPAIAQNNRTLVPVRFAAQAFGCDVGWDQDDRTVIIDDVAAILAENSATYNVMDKYLAYAKKLRTNPYSITGAFDMNMKAFGENNEEKPVSVAMKGTVSGLTDKTGAEMNLTLISDLSDLIQQTEAGQTVDAQVLMMATMLQNVKMDYILNLESGMLYMRSPLFASILGTKENAWISVDINALLTDSGMGVSFGSLMSMSYSADSFEKQLSDTLQMMPLTDKDAATGAMLKMINDMFSDQALVKTGNDYVSTSTVSQSGVSMDIKTTFTVVNDTMTGYAMDMTMGMGETGGMTMTMGMDANNKMNMTMRLQVPSVFEMLMNGTIQFTATTKTPENEPAEGSTVVALDGIKGE